MWKVTLGANWQQSHEKIMFNFEHRKEAQAAVNQMMDLLEYTEDLAQITIERTKETEECS